MVALFWAGTLLLVYTRCSHLSLPPILRDQVVAPVVTVLLLILSGYLVPMTLAGLRSVATVLGAAAGTPSAAGGPDLWGERLVARRALGFVRDLGPLLFAVCAYPTTDVISDCLRGPVLFDADLSRIDVALFGGHPSVWTERFVTAARTDILSLGYALHVVNPAVLLLFLHLFRPRPRLVETAQGLVVIFVVGFALYALVPAIGPRFAFPELYTRDLSGGTLTELNDRMVGATRAARDAFPSMHVAISALLLLYAFRASRLLGLVLLLPTVGNWVSTVYLRYHYGIDVVAGFLLVPLIDVVVRRYGRLRVRWPARGAGPG